MKKPHASNRATVHTATRRENDFPTYAGEVKPEMAHDGIPARVRPTTARVHDPLPMLDKMEKVSAKEINKKTAAGR